MAATAKTVAPRLWTLFDHLLMARGEEEEEEEEEAVSLDGPGLDGEPMNVDQRKQLHTDKDGRLKKLRELVSTTTTSY